MKIGRPVYSKETQVYVCECSGDSFRFESVVEGGQWKPELSTHLESTREQMIGTIVDGTTGWFSKPLTRDWLQSKLVYKLPTDVPTEFEGVVRWRMNKLHISKETFTCEFVVYERVMNTVPLIDLQDEEPVKEQEKEQEQEPPKEHKKKAKEAALLARRRAAMALLKAERLMQAYSEEFGEDTEWEEEEDEFVP
jgi:hypothetical protein